MKKNKPFGFTLIELLVALAILAALTTVAIRAVDGLQLQARYQQTTRELDDIRSAILGPPTLRAPDGSAQISGFVTDLGRLPQYTSPADPLSELWDSSLWTADPYSFKQSVSDPKIWIGTGWQGPYMRLGPGTTSLNDGWGQPFQLRDTNNPPGPAAVGITSSGVQIGEIRSLGADKLADDNGGGTDGYNLDVKVELPSSGFGSAFSAFTGRIRMLDTSGNLVDPNSTAAGAPVTIWVVYYGPQSATPFVAEVPLSVSSTNNFQYVLSGVAYTPSGSPPPAVAVDSRITIGPRILKAYVINSVAPSFNHAAVSTYEITESYPLNVTALGGVQVVPNLVLPYYAP